MSNICTNIQQSEKLVRLGLDPATSDMWWIDDQLVAKSNKFDVPSNDEETTVHCAWSLSALLEVMRKANAVTTLQVTSLSTLIRCKDMGFIWQNDLHIYDPVTAAYEMVCYLLRNGHIKKE